MVFTIIGISITIGLLTILGVVEKEFEYEQLSARMGQPVNINNLDLTVEDVKIHDCLVFKEFWEEPKCHLAKPGYKFVALFLRVENVGNESDVFDIMGEKLITDKGYIYDEVQSYEISGREDYRSATPVEIKKYNLTEIEEMEDVPPGESIDGWKYFEIKEDHEPSKFTFKSGLWEKNVTVDLTTTAILPY